VADDEFSVARFDHGRRPYGGGSADDRQGAERPEAEQIEAARRGACEGASRTRGNSHDRGGARSDRHRRSHADQCPGLVQKLERVITGLEARDAERSVVPRREGGGKLTVRPAHLDPGARKGPLLRVPGKPLHTARFQLLMGRRGRQSGSSGGHDGEHQNGGAHMTHSQLSPATPPLATNG
jgi:hypothetical protein